ncbi:hypothetical protein [Streptosporangium sp. NPDC002721]|uniref:hypothetical protein n=1 Tax=Streptosporangium sp. NPDC002721 TaxID=3366188 RepID=UPI0036A5881E
MRLTVEQYEADARLRAAIQEFVAAFGLAPDHELISDYVVSGVAVSMNPDRAGETQMFTALPGGSLPHYKILGLLAQTRSFYERDI